MAFIDMRKAFDSVHHSCIIGELRARGVPESLCDYLARYYQYGKTQIGGKRIKVGREVR